MEGEINAISSLTITTGGRLCSCGNWVTHGETHSCGGYALQPYTYYPMTYTTIESGRLAELMEAERKLNEIRRILNGG